MGEQPQAGQPAQRDTEFHPSGAVAFFAAMLVFFSVVWLLLYALMIHRH